MTEKEKFLRKINEAFASYDMAYIIKNVADDVVWTIHGDQEVVGKEAFIKALEAMKSEDVSTLTIHNIITNDTKAAVNGSITMTAPSGEMRTYAFCDVYLLNESQPPIIKEITSYVVLTS